MSLFSFIAEGLLTAVLEYTFHEKMSINDEKKISEDELKSRPKNLIDIND